MTLGHVEFQGRFGDLLILHDDLDFYQGGGLVALSMMYMVQTGQKSKTSRIAPQLQLAYPVEA